ncbi:MAG: hypothetical protein IKT41_01130 [Clostridia bacterium]|nr:hypothetical protein [Clostridia bacterium]
MFKYKSIKVLAILMLVFIMMSILQNDVKGAELYQNVGLQEYGKCEYTLQYDYNGTWYFIETTFVGYSENGRVYPAYCIDKELPGVRRNRSI